MKFIKAGVVIKKENKYLLVQEKAQRVYGLWNIPSGKVEEGMSVEQTAIKEAKEETNLDIKLVRKIKVFTETFPDTEALHIFEGEVMSGELIFPKEEILDARWFTREEIIAMENNLVGKWIVNVIHLI